MVFLMIQFLYDNDYSDILDRTIWSNRNNVTLIIKDTGFKQHGCKKILFLDWIINLEKNDRNETNIYIIDILFIGNGL